MNYPELSTQELVGMLQGFADVLGSQAGPVAKAAIRLQDLDNEVTQLREEVRRLKKKAGA